MVKVKKVKNIFLLYKVIHFNTNLDVYVSLCIISGSAKLSIAVESGTTIRITSAGRNTQCKVCIRQNTQEVCQLSAVLRSDTLLDFSCSQPENVFTVQIIRDNGESCQIKK